MIGECAAVPRGVFNPEETMEKWVVLLGGPRLEPDPPESLDRPQICSGNVRVVIPYESCMQNGQVNHYCDAHNHQADEPILQKQPMRERGRLPACYLGLEHGLGGPRL